MRWYKVIRPYCNPNCLVLAAWTKKDAVKQAHKLYGFASNTKAYKLNLRHIYVVERADAIKDFKTKERWDL